MPAGRPSKYDPKFCQQAIDLMREGCAIAELPYYFNVCVDTIYEWQKVYPEFSEAIKIGSSFSKAIWMKFGRENIANKEFNSGLWFMNMKNRFGWADKVESRNEVKVVAHEDAMKELE